MLWEIRSISENWSITNEIIPSQTEIKKAGTSVTAFFILVFDYSGNQQDRIQEDRYDDGAVDGSHQHALGIRAVHKGKNKCGAIHGQKKDYADQGDDSFKLIHRLMLLSL